MVDICDRLWENWTFQAKFEIEIGSRSKSSEKFFLLFLFFAVVTLTLSLYQISNVKIPQGCCGKTSYLSFILSLLEVVLGNGRSFKQAAKNKKTKKTA